MARPGPHVVDHSLGQSSTLAPHGEYDSWGARGAVNAPPSGFMGTIVFLFFKSLSKVENLSSRKKTVIFHVYYIKIKTAYMYLKIVLLGVT